MRDATGAEKSSSPPEIQISDHFDALAFEFQRAIDQSPDHPEFAPMLERLHAAKELAERGAALARKLPRQ